MSMYYCGEAGCKGHHGFSETCSSIKVVSDYPGLLPFIQGMVDEETQPYEPVKADLIAQKARGQVTPAMKAYDNKMKAPFTAPQKSKSR